MITAFPPTACLSRLTGSKLHVVRDTTPPICSRQLANVDLKPPFTVQSCIGMLCFQIAVYKGPLSSLARILKQWLLPLLATTSISVHAHGIASALRELWWLLLTKVGGHTHNSQVGGIDLMQSR